MIDNELEKVTQKAYKISSLSFLVLLIYASVLYYVLKIVEQTLHAQIITISVLSITVMFSFFSISCKNLRQITCYLISLSCSILNINSCLKIETTFMFAPVLSLYFFDKKTETKIIVFSIVSFLISLIFRAQDFGHFMIGKTDYNWVNSFIGSSTAFSLEAISIISIHKPYNDYLIKVNDRLRREIEQQNVIINETLEFCTTTMSYHSKYLSYHNDNVKEITKIILKYLNSDELSDIKIKEILFAVQFHDFGKIYINNDILDKPSKLTDEEFNLIKEHPIKGYELFQKLPNKLLTDELKQTCKEVILEHHERLNGKGYPKGIKNISLSGQIIAVADVTDALLSYRAYKKPLSWDECCKILKSDDGLNQHICDIVIKHKDEILAIADKNNETIITLF